jgi:hypothetical protein
MQATQPAPETPFLEQENAPRLLPKTIQAMRLVDAGLSEREALQAVNKTDYICDAAVSNFKAKYKRYSLTSEDMVKSAKKVLKDILAGKGRKETHKKVLGNQVVDYESYVYPSHANQASVAQMVYDRYEPLKSNESGGNTTNIFNFDPRSSIKIAEIVTQAAGQLQAQPHISNQPSSQPVDAQVIDVPRLPDNTPTNTPDQW